MRQTDFEMPNRSDKFFNYQTMVNIILTCKEYAGTLFNPQHFTIQSASGGRVVSLSPPNASLKHFTHRMSSTGPSQPKVTITKGSVRIHGRGNISVLETEVSLSGSPCWVYVEIDRYRMTGIITATSTEPVSNGNWLCWPLLKFTPMDGVYEAPEICHDGDIGVDTAA